MRKHKLTLRRLRYTAQIEEKVLRYSGQPQSTRVVTDYGVHLFLWRYFDGNNRVATLVIRKGNEPSEVADCARLNNAWPAIWEISEENVQLSRPKDNARIHAAFLDDEKEACAELAKLFRSPSSREGEARYRKQGFTQEGFESEGSVYLTENGTDVDGLACRLSWQDGLDHFFLHPDGNRDYESWFTLLPELERQEIQNWERDVQRRNVEEAYRAQAQPAGAKTASQKQPHRKKLTARKNGTKEEHRADADRLASWLHYKKNAIGRATIADYARDLSLDEGKLRLTLARARMRIARQNKARTPRSKT